MNKKKKRILAILLCVVMVLATLSVPLVAHAASRYWCTECGGEFRMGATDPYNPQRRQLEHPSGTVEYGDCSHFGVTAYLSSDGTVSSWVTDENPDGSGEGGEEGEGGSGGGAKEMATGEPFIRMMLDTIFGSDDAWDAGGYMAVNNLLVVTFEYLVGALDTLTSTVWYGVIVAMSLVYMLLRFVIDYATGDTIWKDGHNYELEIIFKPFIRLMICMIFVVSVQHFLKLGLFISQAAANVIIENPLGGAGSVDTSSVLETAKDTLIQQLGFEAGGITKLPGNLAAMIEGFVLLIIPYLVSTVGNVAVFFVCFRRVLELGVRAALAPLAMIDLYKEGANGHGIRYIFTYFGVCFQSVAILVVLFISDMISAQIIEGMMTGFSGMLGTMSGISKVALSLAAINLAKNVMVMKTADLAKNAFGGQ